MIEKILEQYRKEYPFEQGEESANRDRYYWLSGFLRQFDFGCPECGNIGAYLPKNGNPFNTDEWKVCPKCNGCKNPFIANNRTKYPIQQKTP